MKIAILGAGAMGMLFGAYLSRGNDVMLFEKDEERVECVNRDGIEINEKKGALHSSVRAAQINGYNAEAPADLVVVFVKSMFEREALEGARGIIGPDTYLMTLQNGEGHEKVLLQYADEKHVIIGTTQDNSSIVSQAHINHGGAGSTYIGLISGDSAKIEHIAETFTACGFKTETTDNIKRLIWNKLFLNASASALTAVFQTNLGFIVDDPYAWELAEKLIAEAVTVANADGQGFDESTVRQEIKEHLERSRGGYTSIYADVKLGRRSEVDTISGAVVTAAERLGIAVPNMKFVVAAIHAMENRNKIKEQ